MMEMEDKVYIRKHGTSMLYNDIVEIKIHEDVRELLRANCIKNGKRQMDSDYVGYLLCKALDNFIENNEFPNGEKKKMYAIDLDVKHYKSIVRLASKEGIVNFVLKAYLKEVNENE